MGFPTHIPFSEYQKLFTLEVMEKVGERWHLRFGALQEYMRQWGGGEPNTDSEHAGIKIGKWLQAQKIAYRKGLLPSDRFELLDNLGLKWESDFDKEERWKRYLIACKEFLTIEGRLPTTGDEFFIEAMDGIILNPQIGQPSLQQRIGGEALKIGDWLTHQRRYYREGKMPQDRIRKMEEVLEIIWEPTKNKWDKNFAAYENYVENTGMQPQRRTKHQGIAIGNWISNNVRQNKYNLTPEWIQRFDELGMIWKKEKVEIPENPFLPFFLLWDLKYKVYKDYVDKTGQQPSSVATRHKGHRIGKWLYKEIIPHKDKLSKEQIKQLEETGVNWESPETKIFKPTKEQSTTKSRSPVAINFNEKNWDTLYIFCRTYLSDFNKLPSSEIIFQDVPIGKWYERQCKDWKAGLLNAKLASRMQSLEEIASLLSTRGKEAQSRPTKDWAFFYDLCKEYLKKFDELPSPEAIYENEPIGKWLETQIEDSKSHRLSSENLRRLETLLHIHESSSLEKQVNEAVEILTRSFSPRQKAIEITVPKAIAAEIKERLREIGIEAKTQNAGGSEIKIRVEAQDKLPPLRLDPAPIPCESKPFPHSGPSTPKDYPLPQESWGQIGEE